LNCLPDRRYNAAEQIQTGDPSIRFTIGLLPLILGAAARAFSCDAPAPEWIFCEDFESGDLSNWDASMQTLDQYRTIIADPGPAGANDNHVFRLRLPEGRGGKGINRTFTPEEYEKLYARWFIAYEAGFDFTARNHGHGLHAGDRWKRGAAGTRPGGDDWFTAQVEYLPVSATNPVPRTYIYAYYRGMGMDCSDPGSACWGDHIPCMVSDYYCDRRPSLKATTLPPPLKQESWYCMEMMLEAGDPVAAALHANGRLNLWVNGLEIGPWENMWFRTDADVLVNHFWLGLFHHEHHSREGIRFDDVVVSTARIACGTNGDPRSSLAAPLPAHPDV